MNRTLTSGRPALVAAAALLLVFVSGAHARIDGETGPNFTLTAKEDHISTADGGSYLIWGFALNGGRAQYPGPTLIVNQGDTVTVTLNNALAVPVSIVFPGQGKVATAGGVPGVMTAEAAAGGSVTYTFIASQPGTYLYHSGTDPRLQVEMGLVGAIIVRPLLGANFAYNDPATKFDREYLFLLTEMDPLIHQAVEFKRAVPATRKPVYWFINGRTGPDTMSDPYVAWLPSQPYNAFPRMHPGERLLMRVIGGGHDSHPFHHHGNHARVIARDGRLMQSAPSTGLDLAQDVFVINSVPGQTVDAIFEWTGKGLGWDIYGTAVPHTCNGKSVEEGASDGFDPVTKEWCGDHGKEFPVTLPPKQFLVFGPFYSGSPFMGAVGSLPPGEGGMNPFGGFPFMWHSHNEKELTNYNIYPGGLLTMLIIEPPGAPIQ